MSKIPDHIIFFDGECMLCNRLIQLVIRKDKKKIFYFAHLQSQLGKRMLQQVSVKTNTFIYVQNGKAYTQSTAALKICGKLSGGYKLLYPFVYLPGLFRDPVYKLISRYRYKWFGKYDTCMLPDEDTRKRFISSGISG